MKNKGVIKMERTTIVIILECLKKELNKRKELLYYYRNSYDFLNNPEYFRILEKSADDYTELRNALFTFEYVLKELGLKLPEGEQNK